LNSIKPHPDAAHPHAAQDHSNIYPLLSQRRQPIRHVPPPSSHLIPLPVREKALTPRNDPLRPIVNASFPAPAAAAVNLLTSRTSAIPSSINTTLFLPITSLPPAAQRSAVSHGVTLVIATTICRLSNRRTFQPSFETATGGYTTQGRRLTIVYTVATTQSRLGLSDRDPTGYLAAHAAASIRS